jgi:hypothetical protein
MDLRHEVPHHIGEKMDRSDSFGIDLRVDLPPELV